MPANLPSSSLITLHETCRVIRAAYQRHLAFPGHIAVDIGDLHAIAGHRTAHRADLELLARELPTIKVVWSGRNRRG